MVRWRHNHHAANIRESLGLQMYQDEMASGSLHQVYDCRREIEYRETPFYNRTAPSTYWEEPCEKRRRLILTKRPYEWRNVTSSERQAAKGSARPSYTFTKLLGHKGCVNALNFHPVKPLLFSGGDNTEVLVHSPLLNHPYHSILSYPQQPTTGVRTPHDVIGARVNTPIHVLKTAHNKNIFTVQPFLDDTSYLVTGSGDNSILRHDIHRMQTVNTCEFGPLPRNYPCILTNDTGGVMDASPLDTANCTYACLENYGILLMDFRLSIAHQRQAPIDMKLHNPHSTSMSVSALPKNTNIFAFAAGFAGGVMDIRYGTKSITISSLAGRQRPMRMASVWPQEFVNLMRCGSSDTSAGGVLMASRTVVRGRTLRANWANRHEEIMKLRQTQTESASGPVIVHPIPERMEISSNIPEQPPRVRRPTPKSSNFPARFAKNMALVAFVEKYNYYFTSLLSSEEESIPSANQALLRRRENQSRRRTRQLQTLLGSSHRVSVPVFGVNTNTDNEAGTLPWPDLLSRTNASMSASEDIIESPERYSDHESDSAGNESSGEEWDPPLAPPSMTDSTSPSYSQSSEASDYEAENVPLGSHPPYTVVPPSTVTPGLEQFATNSSTYTIPSIAASSTNSYSSTVNNRVCLAGSPPSYPHSDACAVSSTGSIVEEEVQTPDINTGPSEDEIIVRRGDAYEGAVESTNDTTATDDTSNHNEESSSTPELSSDVLVGTRQGLVQDRSSGAAPGAIACVLTGTEVPSVSTPSDSTCSSGAAATAAAAAAAAGSATATFGSPTSSGTPNDDEFFDISEGSENALRTLLGTLTGDRSSDGDTESEFVSFESTNNSMVSMDPLDASQTNSVFDRFLFGECRRRTLSYLAELLDIITCFSIESLETWGCETNLPTDHQTYIIAIADSEFKKMAEQLEPHADRIKIIDRKSPLSTVDSASYICPSIAVKLVQNRRLQGLSRPLAITVISQTGAYMHIYEQIQNLLAPSFMTGRSDTASDSDSDPHRQNLQYLQGTDLMSYFGGRNSPYRQFYHDISFEELRRRDVASETEWMTHLRNNDRVQTSGAANDEETSPKFTQQTTELFTVMPASYVHPREPEESDDSSVPVSSRHSELLIDPNVVSCARYPTPPPTTPTSSKDMSSTPYIYPSIEDILSSPIEQSTVLPTVWSIIEEDFSGHVCMFHNASIDPQLAAGLEPVMEEGEPNYDVVHWERSTDNVHPVLRATFQNYTPIQRMFAFSEFRARVSHINNEQDIAAMKSIINSTLAPLANLMKMTEFYFQLELSFVELRGVYDKGITVHAHCNQGCLSRVLHLLVVHSLTIGIQDVNRRVEVTSALTKEYSRMKRQCRGLPALLNKKRSVYELLEKLISLPLSDTPISQLMKYDCLNEYLSPNVDRMIDDVFNIVYGAVFSEGDMAESVKTGLMAMNLITLTNELREDLLCKLSTQDVNIGDVMQCVSSSITSLPIATYPRYTYMCMYISITDYGISRFPTNVLDSHMRVKNYVYTGTPDTECLRFVNGSIPKNESGVPIYPFTEGVSDIMNPNYKPFEKRSNLVMLEEDIYDEDFIASRLIDLVKEYPLVPVSQVTRVDWNPSGEFLLVLRSNFPPLVYMSDTIKMISFTSSEQSGPPVFVLAGQGLYQNTFTRKDACWAEDGLTVLTGSEHYGVLCWRLKPYIKYIPYVLEHQSTMEIPLSADFKGHTCVVNNVSARCRKNVMDQLPMFASSGIESIVGLWSPYISHLQDYTANHVNEYQIFDGHRISDLMEPNARSWPHTGAYETIRQRQEGDDDTIVLFESSAQSGRNTVVERDMI